jgi:virulence factor Mce-like protein
VRRLLAILVVVLVAVGGASALFLSTRSSDDDTGRYFVELDNAFGLIEGADVKVAGVRAGRVSELKLDRGDMRALIGVELTQPGFRDLRADAFCESRPQSLIGEYFLDCQPGRGRKLRAGGTLPVTRTGSTVPVDLVNNIMRRPYRERFSILLSELGAGLAARGDDLNDAIRRANPALRETDEVLALLREQKTVIRNLNEDADEVLFRLAGRKEDVSRFVMEARDTARVSASRDDELRGQFQRLPTFLRELRPTMRLLGQAADRQIPALRNLNLAADDLEGFLTTLGPFSERRARPSARSPAPPTGAAAPSARRPRRSPSCAAASTSCPRSRRTSRSPSSTSTTRRTRARRTSAPAAARTAASPVSSRCCATSSPSRRRSTSTTRTRTSSRSTPSWTATARTTRTCSP